MGEGIGWCLCFDAPALVGEALAEARDASCLESLGLETFKGGGSDCDSSCCCCGSVGETLL